MKTSIRNVGSQDPDRKNSPIARESDEDTERCASRCPTSPYAFSMMPSSATASSSRAATASCGATAASGYRWAPRGRAGHERGDSPMSYDLEPVAGGWYRHLDKDLVFRVITVDEDNDTIQLQHYDGDLEEIDSGEWYAMDMSSRKSPRTGARARSTKKTRTGSSTMPTVTRARPAARRAPNGTTRTRSSTRTRRRTKTTPSRIVDRAVRARSKRCAQRRLRAWRR